MRPTTVLVFAIFFLAACNISNKQFSDGNRWIPADFNIKTDILLIETYPVSPKSNEKMETFLEEKYKGKYEVVDRKIIMDKPGKYADTKKYRFAFIWDSYRSVTGMGNYQRAYDFNGHFLDLATGKRYPTTKKTNNYGQKSYIPFLNAISRHYK